MEFQDARNLVDKLVFEKSSRYLSDPEVEVLRGAWEGITYAQMARESQYSENYLMRDVGPNLFRLLKDALEEDVSKANFRAALERRQVALGLGGFGLQSSPHQDWGEAPDISTFYGRDEELGVLKQWLVADRCRLVTLFGMGGVGKTTLARKLAEEVQDEFDYVVWRSLQSVTHLQDLLQDWFEFFPHLDLEHAPEEPHNRISAFLHLLNQHRCLFILDDVESVLHADETATDSNYQKAEDFKLFLRRLGSSNHKSCMVLISREKIRPIIELEQPNIVSSCHVEGLRNEDARSILEDRQLSGQEEWDTLIRLAKGVPLALKLISADIRDLFDGNVAEFLKYPMTWIFDDELSLILEEQYSYLDDRARELIHYFAEQDGPIPFDSLTDTLSNQSTSSVMKSLLTLIQRDWIEKLHPEDNNSDKTWYQAPFLVRKYVKRFQALDMNPAAETKSNLGEPVPA